MVKTTAEGSDLMKDSVVVLSILVMGLVASGCGKDETSAAPASPAHSGTVSFDSTNPYCFLNVQAEPNPSILPSVMKQLMGTWKHHKTNADINDSGDNESTLFFDSGKPEIVFRQFFGWYDTKDVINYRKLCLSTPLTETSGPYLVGFRVFEAMASNNEGGVAFVLKLDLETGDGVEAKLLLSDYYYRRFAAYSRLEELSSFTSKIRHIRTYGELQK